jgi:hypothetical protein
MALMNWGAAPQTGNPELDRFLADLLFAMQSIETRLNALDETIGDHETRILTLEP